LLDDPTLRHNVAEIGQRPIIQRLQKGQRKHRYLLGFPR
jgi:hypothetical protein